MRYPHEPNDRTFVRRYELFSFKIKMGKSLSSKYGQKRLDSAKKLTADAVKTASKRAIQKQQKQLVI